jgi:hypothetical protein
LSVADCVTENFEFLIHAEMEKLIGPPSNWEKKSDHVLHFGYHFSLWQQLPSVELLWLAHRGNYVMKNI